MNKILSYNSYGKCSSAETLVEIERLTESGSTEFKSKNSYYFDENDKEESDDERHSVPYLTEVVNCPINFETVDVVVPKIYEQLYKYMLRFHKDLHTSEDFHYNESLNEIHKYAMSVIGLYKSRCSLYKSTVKSLEMNGEVLYEIIYLEHYRVKMASSLKPEIRITDSVPTDLLIMYK